MTSSSAVALLEEREGRFTHLLKPIRDLAESWSIDLAGELEEYLSELASIQISLDGGLTALNFAEAALLIQGSACVYSKKVEYLYSLVYQTLNRVSEKERAPQALSVDETGADADAPTATRAHDEFLALDDLPEAQNLYLTEDSGRGEDSLTSKTPLLILSNAAGGGANSSTLQMRSASMHESGILMLDDWAATDPASTSMLNTLLEGMATASGQRLAGTGAQQATLAGMVPSPALAGQLTFDHAAGEGARGGDDDDDCDGADFGAYDDDPGFETAPGARGNELPSAFAPFPERAQGAPLGLVQPRAAPSDAPAGPWTPLDPNDASGVAGLRPFRKGRTWKLPPKSAGLLSSLGAGLKRDAHGRPRQPPTPAEAAACCVAQLGEGAVEGENERSALEREREARERVGQGVAGMLSRLGMASSHAWSIKGPTRMHDEFARALEAEAKRRAAVRKVAREELAKHSHVAPTAEADAEADLDMDAEPAAGPGEAAADVCGLDAPAPFDDDDDADELGHEAGYGGEEGFATMADNDFGDSAALSERADLPPGAASVRLSTPSSRVPAAGPTLTSYEKRYWAELAQLGAAQDADGALHARVSSWEARLLPVLEEQDRRRQFDIELYGNELLARMPDAVEDEDPSPAQRRKGAPSASHAGSAKSAVPFAELVAGQERFEVCRMFLAALQLANNRNIEILPGSESSTPQPLQLRLLTRESCFRLEDVGA